MIYLILTENPHRIIKCDNRKKAEIIKSKLKHEYSGILIEMYIAYPVTIETQSERYTFKKGGS